MDKRTHIFNDRIEFNDFVKTNKYVVVKITAKWCGPCQRCKPLFEELFMKLPSSFKYVEVDVDECEKLTGMFRAKSIPTIINFIDGDPQDIMVGGDEEVLRSFFEKTKKRLN